MTDYADFPSPLFSPTHLGEKWPAVDYCVELTTLPGKRPFFFVQAKATAATAPHNSLRISSTREDVARLLEIPAPTYILGVHEPSKRVFIRSVHDGVAVKAITQIPATHELTSSNLKMLHDEVVRFWKGRRHKPTKSVFA
ncbi:MAG: hypothetical protein HY820_03010 [Acidobacteria bacterium]|nr:hypothetical protein [Acidobacteriota bacterium]